MIKNKEKPCKGLGKAKGFGCGRNTFFRKLGLGINCKCYQEFLRSSNGQSYLNTAMNKAKSISKAEKKDKDKKIRESLKTKSDYEKDLQKEINTIIRLIDKGSVCISTLKPLNDKFDAGHYFSVGSTPTLRFNLFNIYAQSVHANQHLSGDSINFIEGIRFMYGKEHAEYVSGLRARYKLIKLYIDDIKEKIIIARDIVKRLKLLTVNLDSEKRLFMRKIYNQRLGIYE